MKTLNLTELLETLKNDSNTIVERNIEIGNTDNNTVYCANGYAVAKNEETNHLVFLIYPKIEKLKKKEKEDICFYRTNEMKTNIHYGDIMMYQGKVVLNPNPSEKYIK